MLCFEGMRWNFLFETLTIQSAQSKPNKLKYIPMLAGVDRHCDFLLALGDWLTHDHGMTEWSSDKKTWLFPELRGNDEGKTAATKLTSWIKTLQVDGLPGMHRLGLLLHL